MDSLTPESIGSTLEALNLSKDECSRLTKAFQDDEFKKLFLDYAREVEDPKNRAESEAYLRQLEREGKAEEVYGAGTQLVVPEPGFVVETCASSGAKVFINVCSSPKVDAASSTRQEGGESWSIPFSLSSIHVEKDKSDQSCDAVDFCVSDKTLRDAEDKPRLRALLVDTALEETEKRFDLKLDRKVTMPNRKYMGAGKPRVLAVRSTGGPAPGQRLKPADKPAQPAPQPAQGNGTGKGSAFTFDAAKRAKSANPSPPLVSTTFEYEIVHQTLANVADTWKDARATNSSTRPTSLLVRIKLVGVSSVGEVSLDLSQRSMMVSAAGRELTLELPFEVDDEKGKAKFDKVKQTLEVSLPVLRAPVVTVPIAEEAQPQQEVLESPPGPNTPPASEGGQTGESGEHGETEGSIEPVHVESSSIQPGPSEPAVSENERLWRSLHATAALKPPEPSAQEPRALESVLPDMSYQHPPDTEEPHSAVVQTAVTKLPPRLQASMHLDLD